MKRYVNLKKYLLLLNFFVFNLIGQSNHLKKVFFHQGILVDKLVFYCMNPPLLTHSTHETKDRMKFTCEFLCTFSDDPSCQDRIGFINKMQKKKIKKSKKYLPYTLSIDCDDRSTGKITVSIDYDPEFIEVYHDEFKSISNSPAVVFSIVHKKALLKSLRKKSRWFNLPELKKKRNIRIVIDPGHGGSDDGACGTDGIKEKNITLKISRLLVEELKKEGCDVFVTRSTDLYVPLDERTALTNLIANADLFISLHGNASSNKQAAGVETYFLSDNKRAPNDFEKLMKTFSQRGKKLANEVQTALTKIPDAGYTLRNRGVKDAVSQVLLGVEAPAVLVEIGFLSNDTEARQLNLETYQKKVAHALSEGILSYIGTSEDFTHK